MIAPRPKKPQDAPVTADGTELAALRKLAAESRGAYGTWRPVASDAEALDAIVTEVGEVLLARRIRVTAQDTGIAVEMTVSNRHLVTLAGPQGQVQVQDAGDVVRTLREGFTGAGALKFEITERAPMMSQTARSWPHDALRQAMQAPDSARDGAQATLIRELQAMADAWLDLQTQQSSGAAERVSLLTKHANALAEHRTDATPLQRVHPRLSLVPISEAFLLVDVCLGQQRLLLSGDPQSRADYIAQWRGYCSAP
ncbi:MAG: hypothetical protein GJ677_04500 [Rhodobacteraceae bacterium]|nr:hypothetical protein [Paracoccaceae bacterium]